MKSISFAKLITLGCFALMLPVACGDDDDDTPGPSKGGSSGSAGKGSAGEETGGVGGEGGASTGTQIPGTSKTSQTIECSTSCSSTKTTIALYIDPCCTPEAAGNECGVSSGFLSILGTDLKGACLPKDQPGELDASCATSPSKSVTVGTTTVPVNGFPGCCLPNGTCGFQVNEIVAQGFGQITKPNLGCVPSAAFGAPAVPCGAGGAGGGGAGGASGGEGGAPVVGGGGAGGAP
jgi:hypothetical protein